MRQPLSGRSVLVIGPDGPFTRGLAAAARHCGAHVALSTAGGANGTGSARRLDPGFASGAEDEVDGLFDRAAAGLPPLDTIVVVVGTKPLGALHEVSVECWNASVSDSLRQVFWLARRAVEGFLADAVEGRLVLVVEPVPGGGGTNDVVEAGLRAFSSSFAREYGRRSLSCNAVLSTGSPEASATVRDVTSAVIEQAIFLASPAASFVNGEVILVRWASDRADLGAST